MDFKQFYLERLYKVPYDFGDCPVSFGMRHNASDISAHMPLLQMLASWCSHITEFGCRECYSTSAFIQGCKLGGKVVSYDIVEHLPMKQLKSLEKRVEWDYVIQDTSKEDFLIEETDMLFIDSLHTYNQVQAELSDRHVNRVRRFLVFHDVVSQGTKSLDVPGEKGILDAITEFCETHSEWIPKYYSTFNHGLLVLEKVGKW